MRLVSIAAGRRTSRVPGMRTKRVGSHWGYVRDVSIAPQDVQVADKIQQTIESALEDPQLREYMLQKISEWGLAYQRSRQNHEREIPNGIWRIQMIDIRFEEDSVIEEFRRLGEVALANFFAKNRAELERLVRLRLDRRVARRVDAFRHLARSIFRILQSLAHLLGIPPNASAGLVRRLARQVVARVQREHFDAQKRDIRREAYGTT